MLDVREICRGKESETFVKASHKSFHMGWAFSLPFEAALILVRAVGNNFNQFASVSWHNFARVFPKVLLAHYVFPEDWDL